MRILHVSPSFAPAWWDGGLVEMVVGLTRALAQQGHEVEVVTTNANGVGVLDVALDRPVEFDGVRVSYFPVQWPRGYRFSAPLGTFLRDAVRRADVAHLHSVFLWPTSAAAFWCRRLRVPYLVAPAGALDPACLGKTYEGRLASMASRAKKLGYLRTVGRLDLGRAAALHCTSEHERDALARLGLRIPTVVVPPGVDWRPAATVADLDPPLRAALAGKRAVVFLSRIDPKKGLDLLIPAMADVCARRADAVLVVAGRGPAAYEARVAALVRRLHLEGRVVFPGWVGGEAKWALLRVAEVFVLPSYDENFGIAVGEAMAAGVPVVISNQVALHPEVSASGAGIVTALDVRAIAAAIEAVLADPGRGREMGTRGAALARRRFAWERVVADMLHAYRQVLGKPSPDS